MFSHVPFTRLSVVCSVTVCLVAGSLSAQPWAAKMVNKLDHNFETVARGSDTIYKFEFTNIYKEDVHLSSVRSSCGCTTPSIENNLIKTWEKAYVIAKFNTRTFTGVHSATLTVTIDKPFPAQVQLRVHGNIRGDVVFEPGKVDFGTVDQGSPIEKVVSVKYAGRSGWRLNDVRSASDDLEVELTERPTNSSSRASYDLLVRLKPTAKPGILKEQLVLVTSDNQNPRIPLDVEGRVVPELSVAPANLVFGDLPKGVEVNKRLIVKGKKPFRVLNVSCQEEGFEFKTDGDSRDRHIIDVAFTPKRAGAKLKAPIVIETDLGSSYTASCTAYASLVAPPSAEPKTSVPPTDPAESTASEVETEETDEKLAQGS